MSVCSTPLLPLLNARSAAVFSEVEVPAENYFLWQAGELAQVAFPQLNIYARETLISGLCMVCQNNIFEKDDEDEDE